MSPLALVNNGRISTLTLCIHAKVHMQVEEDGSDSEQRGHEEHYFSIASELANVATPFEPHSY